MKLISYIPLISSVTAATTNIIDVYVVDAFKHCAISPKKTILKKGIVIEFPPLSPADFARKCPSTLPRANKCQCVYDLNVQHAARFQQDALLLLNEMNTTAFGSVVSSAISNSIILEQVHVTCDAYALILKVAQLDNVVRIRFANVSQLHPMQHTRCNDH